MLELPPDGLWLSSLDNFFATWPERVAACHADAPNPSDSTRRRTPKQPRYFFLNVPSTHPQLHNHDCRTGPRMHYWNVQAAEAALERGWEVVDVEAYTKAGQIDSRYGDGIHCAFPSPLAPFPPRACLSPLRLNALTPRYRRPRTRCGRAGRRRLSQPPWHLRQGRRTS